MKLYKQNEMNDADSRAAKQFNDSAAIDDMVENEAPISNSSAQGAAVDKSGNNWTKTPRILSVVLKKFAPSERNVVPGSLVTYNACSGPTDVLKGVRCSSADGVAKGRNRKIYVKFMVPGKMQSFIKHLSLTQLLWHDKVGFELRSKADVKRSVAETLECLITHYCRDVAVQMLYNSGADLDVSKVTVNADTVDMLRKIRTNFLARDPVDDGTQDLKLQNSDNSSNKKTNAEGKESVTSESNSQATSGETLKPRFVPDAEHLSMLSAMGFLEEQARYALRAAENDMQRAANFLMDPSSMPELPPEEPQEASQKASEI